MESSSALFELASVSLACRDQDTLLKTFAARAGAVIGARGVLVWLSDPESEDGALACRMRWSEPGERFQPAGEESEDGLLAEVFEEFSESGGTRRVGAKEVDAGELAHLDEASRGRVKTMLFATLPGAQGAIGVVEALNKRSGEFTAEDAQFLEEAGKLAGQALTNLTAIEQERESQLATLERLTALYDLGRTFTSTLELAELLPIVAGKIRDILGAAACNLWLADAAAGELFLAQKVGEEPSAEEGARVSMSEGLLGEVAQTANAKLIEEAGEDEALAERRETAGEEFEIQTWMAAPLRKEDQILGVVELVNKADGEAFTEEDLFFLSSISEQAAVALHNANLLESERKVHALDALLKISQEITSTLDLDHVLTTVVHEASTIIPFDKCVIGFYDRGRFILGAVSGETEVPKTREMNALRDRLQWVAEQEGAIAADMYDDGWHMSPDEARAQFASFLEEHEYNGFYALALRDDQGNLGTLALLSGDADFLTDNHKETLTILANQTTVAIRNAQLYQQVPLMNLLQPLAQRKQKLMASVSKGRWVEHSQRAALIALALAVIPWPMRVGTDATVVPAERRRVSTIEGGVVQRVFVHEGDAVQAGQMLAQLDDGQDRVKLAQATADLEQARRELAEAEYRNDPAAAGQARIRADLHTAETNLEQQRIQDAQLRAPIPGVVVTPKVEDKTGTMIPPGESFCEIVAQDRMAAEMSVAESDLGLVQTGETVSLKLNAFPTRTFEGRVDRVGTQAHAESGEQYFLIRAVFENPGGRARDGMVGRARVQARGGWFHSGWYPIGYVILRSPFRWAWQKAWGLLP
ncbi:MAG TPA: efflux RND transporter periplasmic adaptor subunit [Candidatus Acidoferrales bacterium]|nr:efflux RND transporter periplasmic adaptor subunit [Candidatus Acidoferrales bacterium]